MAKPTHTPLKPNYNHHPTTFLNLIKTLQFFVFLLLLVHSKVSSYSDVWASKNPGKDHSLDDVTTWMKEGALPQNEFLVPKSGEKSLRKEYRTLSTKERHQFHDCLLKLKNSPAVGAENLSQYDSFVIHHTYDYSPEAHDSPCFLPFHRVFLYILERLMRSHEGCHDSAIHYWDTTLDSMLPNPADTVIFNHPDYIGNKNGTVDTGFLKDWGPVLPEQCEKYGVNLTRSLCEIQYALLLNQEVDSFVHCGSFEQCVFPKSRRFEDAHGQVHNCVGGHMSDLLCAPNDPIFFMYHSFVDLVFQEYIDYNYPRQIGIELSEDYPKENQQTFWNANSPMFPFAEFSVIDGLSRNFSDNLVQYEPRPRRCKSQADCTKGRSDVLWCDIRVGMCLAKIYVNGNCEGYSDEACYNACKSNEVVVCDQGNFTCQCKVTHCFSDDECVGKGELCVIASNKCTKRLNIGQFCGNLPDKFCMGECSSLNDVLKCVKGKCSCELKVINCEANDEIDLCPRGFYCDALGLCRIKVFLGGACELDRMCESRCYQRYTPFCSRTSHTCHCILKYRLALLQRTNPSNSIQNPRNHDFGLDITTKHVIDSTYCRSEADCGDERQLCLRKKSRKFIFVKKECYLVACGKDRDCRRKGISKSMCQNGHCARR